MWSVDKDFEAGRFAPRRGMQARLDRLVDLVAAECGVSSRLVRHASRCRAPVAHARQLAMYLTHVMLGESLTAVGLAFGRDRTTVSHACARIEDLRDDTAFDARVERLEDQIARWTEEVCHEHA